MCDPMTAIAVVSAGASYMSGQSNAKATAKAQNTATLSAYDQLNEKETQLNQASAMDESERLRQGMIERGKIAASSGESGALGLSADRLLGHSLFDEGSDITAMEKGRQMDIQTIERQKSGTQLTSQNRITEAYNSAPSLIGTGLQIGGSIYAGNKAAKEKVKVKTGI